MKTLDQYQEFADELKVLCEKHRIGLIGTDESEGIYGEITLVDLDEPEPHCSWEDPLSQISYTVVKEIDKKSWASFDPISITLGGSGEKYPDYNEEETNAKK